MSCITHYALVIAAGAAMALPLPPVAAASDRAAKHRAAPRDLVADAREKPWATDASAAEEVWERDPIAFSARDRATIRRHYRAAGQRRPAGATKQTGKLSPGLRKQLRRNALLSPRLQQRLEPLDGEVERTLNPLPWGYSRGLIGKDALIVEGRTQRVMDIIRDVTGRR
ncbi:MAG TPA: hypothetical protein VLA96_08630 [Terriglobales bacterium]|nr:hypothetical protein [Terriglobales bacterium]